MKKTLKALLLLPAMAMLTACSSDDSDTWDDYAEWREANISWLEEQAALTDSKGQPIYTKVTPTWNSNAYVLMRWFNDTTANRDNLRPLLTSTVDVKYYGRLYNDQPFDSSYARTVPADSIYRCQISSTIGGWIIAMERMHVGDSVEVLIPYQQAYGSQSSGSYILPYSALRFNIKLVDVAGEYIKP
jgi:FKBP-type peptidyl-prolyl cis-trans isomerase FklB